MKPVYHNRTEGQEVIQLAVASSVNLNHNCLLSTAHTTGRIGKEVAQSLYQVTSASVFEIIFLPLQLCFLYDFNELNCKGEKKIKNAKKGLRCLPVGVWRISPCFKQ